MATETLTATSYPTAYETSGSIYGTRYQSAIGKGSDTSAVSGNDYASGGSSSKAYIYYSFDFDAIPDSATIDSVECAVKGHAENTSRSTCNVQLYVGTSTAKGSSSKFTSTSAQTLTLTTGTWTVAEVKDMRLRFEIGYYGGLINGATVTVTYTFDATKWRITISNSTSVAVTTSDAEVYDGESATITAASLDGITVTDNGTDVTSQFTAVYPETSASTVLGTYALVSGSFNSGESWFEGIVGNGADTTDTTTSNYYSGGSGTIAVFTYDMGITIPSNAEVTRLWCEVSGHAESTSNSNEYMCAQLISGSTDLTDELNFKSVGTSNTVQTLEATTLPTVAQLAAMKLQCRLGYYGGAINGATAHVEYEVPGATIDHYEYTITNIAADHTLVVSAGSSGPTLYVKQGSAWVQVTTAYRKVNGSWQQVALDQAFTSGTNYRRAD